MLSIYRRRKKFTKSKTKRVRETGRQGDKRGRIHPTQQAYIVMLGIFKVSKTSSKTYNSSTQPNMSTPKKKG